MYDIILKYESVLGKLGVFIEKGPYKLDYILDKLQISRSSFYHKRKNNNFSIEEVKVLARLYDDIDATTRLQLQIDEGLKDIKSGRVQDFDKVIAETRAKYGL